MEEIKVTAKTYDEAITEALIQLSTTSDHLDVKIIEEGTAGLFGVLGGKPWVITARALSDEELEAKERAAEEKKEEPVKQESAKPESVKPEPAEQKSEEPEADEQKIVGPEQAKEEPAKKESAKEVPVKKEQKKEENEERKEVKELKPVSEAEADELAQKAVTFLKEVFDRMDMEVAVETSFDHSENELGIVLSGDDMGVLIGKRGQTLDSLQYLTSLVVNKHRDGYIRVKLDTENYRERRKEKLEDFAHNIAQKVKKSRRKVELEPMNPYERRIIHSALQSDAYVTTISEGEEPYRHIVVIPKKDSRRRNNKNRR